MISEKMKYMVANGSAIRAMFEEGNRLIKLYGAENVFDFSLGNPNVPAPESVKSALIEIVEETDPILLHGYTSNSGYADVKEAVAASLNKRFGTKFEGYLNQKEYSNGMTYKDIGNMVNWEDEYDV